MANLFNAKDLLNKVDLSDAKDLLTKVNVSDAKDLFNKVDEIVDKIQSNKELMDKFQKDPVSALESIIGIDLPNDQLDKLIDAIKAKMTIDDIGDVINGLGKLFNRK